MTAVTPDQRITLTEIRRHIIDAENPFDDADMIPLPCHPENISIGYALRNKDKILPVSGLLPREELLQGASNAVSFEKNPALREAFFSPVLTRRL